MLRDGYSDAVENAARRLESMLDTIPDETIPGISMVQFPSAQLGELSDSLPMGRAPDGLPPPPADDSLPPEPRGLPPPAARPG